MDISKFLNRSEGPSGREPHFLADISSEEFDKLLTGGETLHFDPTDILISEGAQDTSLYILLDGEVDVLAPTQKGWLQVASLTRGSVIGEMTFLDNLPRSARVVAKTPCSALRVTRASFQEFALREPLLAMVFVWELSRTVSVRMRRVERFDAAEVARGEERKSLAAELHDETMGDLGSMAVELAFMKRQAASEAPDLEVALDELRLRLRATDKRLREIVQGIYPPVLALRGLESAVNSYLGEYSARTIDSPYPLEIEMQTKGFDKERLHEDLEIGVYRVIQQGIANVIQHVQAKKLRIELVWSDSAVTFSLTDDGVGFDVNAPKESPTTGHFGLANLRDRTERLRGTLEIESKESAGTTIRGKVPVVTSTPRPTEVQTYTYLLNNQGLDEEGRGQA